MTAVTVPKVFFNIWFWYAVMAVIITINYFWGKPIAPKKPSEFWIRHKKAITRITDIFLICVVLLWSPFLLYNAAEIFKALSDPEPIRTTSLEFALAVFFTTMILWLGSAGLFIGLLSVFQSNLTKTKRIILLVICLLPIVFTVSEILMPITEDPWQTARICLYCSSSSWIVNAPAIIMGKHFLVVSLIILRRLRLVADEDPAEI